VHYIVGAGGHKRKRTSITPSAPEKGRRKEGTILLPHN
jgi:hypothetical protein